MYDGELNLSPAVIGRWDIYGPIHKGLRLAHGALMRRLGSADWAADQAPLLADLREHLRLGASHLAHEEEAIHTALEARRPGASQRLADDHEHHRARFAVLEAQAQALALAAPADRPALGRNLYLGFTMLVAEDLAHMHQEETVAWPQLCEAFSDDELKAIEMGIIASLTPEETIGFMRLMIPGMNPAERGALLGGMKAGAPPEAFAAVLELAARPTLSADEWADLQARGIAP